MCGINGFIDFSIRSSKDILVKMTEVLSHRGAVARFAGQVFVIYK